MGVIAAILLALPLSLAAGWSVAAIPATSTDLGQGIILVMLPVVTLLTAVWLVFTIRIVLGIAVDRFMKLAFGLLAAAIGLTLAGFFWLLVLGRPQAPDLQEWIGLIASLLGLVAGVLVQWLCLRTQAI
ncbi:hypothetical protein [Phreatobacter sp.]|uniref:hypothetical protein n=1 Tax=Phreatobacter sp. TaxID=1966341 RepID=UPI0025F9ECC5|nr:hypothetical protein [Phreatobacter sp.]